MKLPARGRWLLIVLAIVLLASAGGIMDRQDSATKPLASAVKPAAGPKAVPGQTDALMISQAGLEKMANRAAAEDEAVDIFKGKSWYVPPPPPPPPMPVPPPPPTAPPMPFAYLGSYRGDDGRLIIFLTRNDRIYSVSPGDVLEGIYRVEEIASGQLVLTYLPLNIRQTINIGEAAL